MDRAAYLARIDQVNREGRYHPDWDSLATHPVPDWYREKRLGIFLHWGVFSVPAYHDWYARNMYIEGSEEYEYHLKHYGPHKTFGFKDFIPSFTMERFDPDAWAALFTRIGADYIVPVAEHHDGFQNYRSELSHWNAAEMGPHRDILGDLLSSAERAGMTVGTSPTGWSTGGSSPMAGRLTPISASPSPWAITPGPPCPSRKIRICSRPPRPATSF